MEAYVINLAHRSDRWTKIQKAFEGTGLKLNRVEAIKHNNGPYGCAMSHLKVIQLAKDTGLPSVLLLEDDCLPGDDFKRRWPIVKKWLDTHPEEWEIFNGGGSVVGECKVYKEISSGIYLFKTGEMWHAHFIYVPQRMYDKVLEYPDKGKEKADRYIDHWFNNEFKVLSIYPFLGKTVNGYSNIEKHHRQNINAVFKNSAEKYKEALKIFKSSSINTPTNTTIKKGGRRVCRTRKTRRKKN